MLRSVSWVGTSVEETYLRRINSYKVRTRNKSLQTEFSTRSTFSQSRASKAPITSNCHPGINSSTSRVEVRLTSLSTKFPPLGVPGFTCMTSTSEPTSATRPWSAARQSMVGAPCKPRIKSQKRVTAAEPRKWPRLK